MGKKKCSKCGDTKPTSQFNKNKSNPDGLRYNCKDCQRALKRLYLDKVKLGMPIKRRTGKYRKTMSDHEKMMFNRLQLIKRLAIKYKKKELYIKVPFNIKLYLKYSD